MLRFSKDYIEYMQSPQWEEFRQRVLKRWQHRCAGCGAHNVVLQIHHITYERLGHERLSDVMPLCIVCHRIADEMRKASKTYKGRVIHVPGRRPKKRRR